MKQWTRYLVVLLIAAGAVGIAAGLDLNGVNAADNVESSFSQQDRREQSRQIQEYTNLMYNILTEVNQSYYKEIDIPEVAIAGLKGMMSALDPYSDFYVEEQDEGVVADLEITTTGTYSGIGATIGYMGGMLSIIAPMKGSPAEGAGLQAGDVIAQIDGTPSKTLSTAKAASLIKGPVDTDVTLMIEREGFPEPLEIIITRQQINVNDVSAASFAAPGVAYIEISRFSKNTGQFLADAIKKLEKEQKIEGLVLDLRGNPGGVLDEAIAVAELFLPPGDMVVYTRGRKANMNQDYKSREAQLFKGNLTVLVNQGSASASEIIAGAIQDLDRGVVVGKTTFGKGLVQQVGGDRKGNVFRLTTGEYFTHSGRNLQRPFVKSASGRLMVRNPSIPDTSVDLAIHMSRNGRTVTGGGGVVPDVEAEGIMGNILLFDLKFRRSMFLRYVNNYVNTRSIKQGAKIKVDAALLDDFQRWSIEDGFTFLSPTEMLLDDLKETAEAEDAADELGAEIKSLEKAIERQKDKMWKESRDKIALELRREFVTKLEGYDAGLLEYMKEDPQFQAAMDVLRDPQRYSTLLSGAIRQQ